MSYNESDPLIIRGDKKPKADPLPISVASSLPQAKTNSTGSSYSYGLKRGFSSASLKSNTSGSSAPGLSGRDEFMLPFNSDVETRPRSRSFDTKLDARRYPTFSTIHDFPSDFSLEFPLDFPEDKPIYRRGSFNLILDPDFDITPVHLLKLFNVLDTNHNGRLTYDEMQKGLSHISRTFQDNVKLDLLFNLIEEIDVDKSHDITQSEFVSAVQEYTARAFSQSGTTSECFIYDYGPNDAYCQWVDDKECSNNLSMSAFTSMPLSLPTGIVVRWIGICGNDMSLFIRTCNKYKIHPLQMEDALAGRERPKVESYGKGDMHIVIGLISLKVDGMFFKVKVHQMNIFMIENKTVLSFMKKRSDIFQLIFNRIMYSGSKIRLGDSRYLVYAIVDSVVDKVYPIIKLFNKTLKELQAQIQAKDTTKLDTIKQIQQIYREVNVLLFWLRPISNVVTRLLEDLPSGDMEMKHHLEDLRDHVIMLQEQSASLVTWARSLNDDYRNEQAHRMSQVMYVLTLVTTIFIPAQFLTGVFGMNFKYMPELTFKYSYLVFWFAVAFLSCCSFLYFKWKGWLRM